MAGRRRVDGAGIPRSRTDRDRVRVDDVTGLACVEILRDEKAPTAVALLRRALAFYRSHTIEVGAGDDRRMNVDPDM